MPEGPRFSSDVEYLPELRRLIVEGRVRLDFDAPHLRGMDSPVAVEAEVSRWAYLMVIASGLAFWWLGWPGALGTIATIGLGYVTLGHRWIASNQRRRIMDIALKEIGTWRKLWRHGGVSLSRVSDVKSPAITCRAPTESWVRFTDDVLRDSDPDTAVPLSSA